MEEILIEEKKFVSSKRAAKMTGYAKDYIGQLCREGRVPARLIGRSWYVLETAIQDHRFGDTEIEPKEATKEHSWESPRYEASSVELLPSINRIKDVDSSADTLEEGQETSQYIQDSWKAWFDRFDTVASAGASENIADSIAESATESVVIPEVSEKPEESEEEKVPIRAIHRSLYHPPPDELLPRNLAFNSPSKIISVRRKNNKRGVRTIQITGALLAVLVATIAVIGSGYLDEYIISSSPARIIAGVSLYNR